MQAEWLVSSVRLLVLSPVDVGGREVSSYPDSSIRSGKWLILNCRAEDAAFFAKDFMGARRRHQDGDSRCGRTLGKVEHGCWSWTGSGRRGWAVGFLVS